MRAIFLGLLAFSMLATSAHAERPKTISGLKNPSSLAVEPGGKIYVTLIGERGRPSDGSIVTVERLGKRSTFATGLDDPEGLAIVGGSHFVLDGQKVWKVDAKGKVEVFVGPSAFPRPPGFLKSIAYDGRGGFYLSDSGNRAGKNGAVFRIDSRKKVVLILDGELTSPRISYPSGLLVDYADHLLVADYGLGDLYRYDLNTGTNQRISGGFAQADGLARSAAGRLFVAERTNGRVFEVTTDLEPPRLVADGFQSIARLAVTPDDRTLLILDSKAGTLTWFPIP